MPPFTVLHVCMGNICRSPMAERLLAKRVEDLAGIAAGELVFSHSCGVGTWHSGERMNSPASTQLRQRGADVSGFRARHMATEHIEISDLILTATSDQFNYIEENYPTASARTFLIRHFGEIVAGIDAGDLPSSDGSPQAVFARGTALVQLAGQRRGDHKAQDLDDPWGLNESTFARIADEIDQALTSFVTRLLS